MDLIVFRQADVLGERMKDRIILILSPCCHKKKRGGTFAYSEESCIVQNLSCESAMKLLELRKMVGTAFDDKHGPDLAFGITEPQIEYLEACRRYAGHLYSEISAESWKKISHTPELKLVIVSALYGLVNFNELIRYYNRTMKDHILHGRLLKTWWKQQGLSSIILDYVVQNKVKKVHDFLSTDYSQAATNLDSGLNGLGVNYFHHSYAGLGSGSDYHRGRDINALIQEY